MSLVSRPFWWSTHTYTHTLEKNKSISSICQIDPRPSVRSLTNRILNSHSLPVNVPPFVTHASYEWIYTSGIGGLRIISIRTKSRVRIHYYCCPSIYSLSKSSHQMTLSSPISHTCACWSNRFNSITNIATWSIGISTLLPVSPIWWW